MEENRDVEFLYEYFMSQNTRPLCQKGSGVGCFLGGIFRTVLPLFIQSFTNPPVKKRKLKEEPALKSKKIKKEYKKPRKNKKPTQSRKTPRKKKSTVKKFKDIFEDDYIQPKIRK